MNSNFAPWQAKGRWYKVEVFSDGANITIDSELAVTEYHTTSYTQIYVHGWLILDAHYQYIDLSDILLYDIQKYTTDAGRTTSCRLPAPSKFTHAIVYIFAYKNAESEG